MVEGFQLETSNLELLIHSLLTSSATWGGFRGRRVGARGLQAFGWGRGKGSFVPEGFDGVEGGGAAGGIDAEEDADHGGEGERGNG